MVRQPLRPHTDKSVDGESGRVTYTGKLVLLAWSRYRHLNSSDNFQDWVGINGHRAAYTDPSVQCGAQDFYTYENDTIIKMDLLLSPHWEALFKAWKARHQDE